MSDKILSGTDLENLLLSWKKKYGQEHTNRMGNPYYKIADMRTALNALVNTFISIGYDYEDLQSVLLSTQIQRSVTPHKYEGKLAEWRIIIDKQWKSAINDFFPDTRLQEAKEPTQVEKPVVFLEKKDDPVTDSGVIVRKDGTTYKERPSIDKSQLKGIVMPEYTLVENDPLAFLKKGKDE